jgi:serine protease Do
MMNTEKNKRKRFLSFFLVFFVGVFVLSVASVMGISYLSLGPTTETAIAASAEETVATPLSFADLAERLKPSVVNIRTTKTVTAGGRGTLRSPFGEGTPFDRFFGDEFMKRFFGDVPRREFKQRSLGSGFIISKDGYIFTNYHVVEMAEKILVKLSDGKEYEATIVGKDKNTDIALLKIKPRNSLPVAVLGDSAKLRVGDWVIAIGNPFGLTQTVTAGIVSAKGRVIGAGPYDDFIQTDASINPGNSGGPLFNLAGEVVGINTAIVAQGQGIGFAIPVNMANQILPDLKTKGKVVRGWLGVSIQDITEDIAESLKLKTQEGVLVSDVFKGDPADKAGLQTGDIIVALNGKKVQDTHELLMIVAGINVGEAIKVTIMRDGTEKVFTVRIAERPEREQLAQREKTGEFFGMTVQEISPEIAEHLGLPDTTGVIVSEIQQGGPADQAGIQPGDIILQVNRTKIQSLKEYAREMSKQDAEKSVLLSIRRKDAKFFVIVRQ